MKSFFDLRLIKAEEADAVLQMRTHFHMLLASMPSILEITGNMIKKDEIDTGEVIYEIGEDKFHFNMFPWKFNGFYINDGMVTFYTFIDEALLKNVNITENDMDRYQITDHEKEVLGIVDEEGADDEEHEEPVYE